MAELRESLFCDRWLVLSAARGDRPDDFKGGNASSKPPSNCPFCRDHEHETGEETLAFKDDDGSWSLRVVHNKFPAVSSVPPMPVWSWNHERLTEDGIGSHEVVVETPEHGVQFAELPLSQVEKVLKAFRHRLKLLKEDERIKYVQVFKNNGREAGASLRHSHSQIIALPVVPHGVQSQVNDSKHYFDKTHTCKLCNVVQHDMEASSSSSSRLIDQSTSFISVAPFAARFPFETWIVPIEHTSSYEDISDAELQDLSRILELTLKKLVKQLNDVPYNYCLFTSPVNQEQSTADYFHWYICILPRTVHFGGFELATGCNINSLAPDKAAQILRSCAI